MRSKTSYQSAKGAYRLTVIVTHEGAANVYDSVLTNTVTGATQTVGGWRNRPDAVDYVQRMYAAKLI